MKPSMPTDAELLRRYAEEKSEAAFAELVERHLGLVYGAALRQLGGAEHRAQDVAQSVFIGLAQQAGSLSHRAEIVGWLYLTTHHVAAKLKRTEQRRAQREQEAHAMNEVLARDPAAAVDWARIRPVLDDAMRELNERDRAAVLLRFFAQRPFAEIGAALDLSEDAARMCVDRALDKLHGLLARRGVTSTAAALGVALANQAMVAAPAGLAGAITSAAVSSATLAGATATTIGIFSMNKTVVLLTTVAFAVSGAAIYELNQVQRADAALVAANLDREAMRARLRAVEQRATEADQDLASLQRAVESARAATAAAEAKTAALAVRNEANRADAASSANNALFAYLGAPVPPPANLDPRYSAEGLAAAFAQLSKTNGLEVQKLFVDDSEYPFLVYGTIAGGEKLKDIREALGTMPGYRYNGSVTAWGSFNGGPVSTVFALNMVPDSGGGSGNGDRRNMLRLQMLRDKMMKAK